MLTADELDGLPRRTEVDARRAGLPPRRLDRPVELQPPFVIADGQVPPVYTWHASEAPRSSTAVPRPEPVLRVSPDPPAPPPGGHGWSPTPSTPPAWSRETSWWPLTPDPSWTPLFLVAGAGRGRYRQPDQPLGHREPRARATCVIAAAAPTHHPTPDGAPGDRRRLRRAPCESRSTSQCRLVHETVARPRFIGSGARRIGRSSSAQTRSAVRTSGGSVRTVSARQHRSPRDRARPPPREHHAPASSASSAVRRTPCPSAPAVSGPSAPGLEVATTSSASATSLFAPRADPQECHPSRSGGPARSTRWSS